MVNGALRYWAFLSYSHADRRAAERLHRALEGYRMPQRLVGRQGPLGPVPRQLLPIFRDRDELPASGHIGAVVETALADSRALIVLCSPASAGSPWVDAEIVAFHRLRPDAPVLCVLLDGEPLASRDPATATRECLPPSLRTRFGSGVGIADAAPVAVDLRPQGDGRRLGVQKLVAGLAGVPLDQLVQRDARRRNVRFAWLSTALAVIAIAMGALAATAWIARNDAQRRQAQAEDLLGFMLGDLRQKLERVGRLDLLDSVGDKAMGYFASLDPRDLTDTTLAQQAQALTQLGQVRLSQSRYPEALASFQNAYSRSRALAQRHPGDGDRLFDRGQAEYWVGFVYWQSRDLDRAQIWLTRYRNTSRAVYAIDPKRAEWQRELAYGDHNLAVLELERGQLQQAAEGFKRSHSTLESVLARTPGDAQLAFEVADEVSWQGNVEEQLGHLDRAEALLASKVESLHRIAAAQPTDPHWKAEWSAAELMQSELLRARGNYAQAEALADGALARMRLLMGFDPDNKQWSRSYLRALVLRAASRIGRGKPAAARDDLALAQPLLDAAAQVAGADRLVRREMLDAFALRGMLALQTGDHYAAGNAAAALLALYQGKPALDSSEEIGRYARSELIAGMAAADAGRPADATGHYGAARRALAPLAPSSSYWRVLDPWVRLSLLTGDVGEAKRVQGQLASYGYVPLFAWPSPATGEPMHDMAGRTQLRTPAQAALIHPSAGH
jgi:tetratricopeptide (TPR) repeat protein